MTIVVLSQKLTLVPLALGSSEDPVLSLVLLLGSKTVCQIMPDNVFSFKYTHILYVHIFTVNIFVLLYTCCVDLFLFSNLFIFFFSKFIFKLENCPITHDEPKCRMMNIMYYYYFNNYCIHSPDASLGTCIQSIINTII